MADSPCRVRAPRYWLAWLFAALLRVVSLLPLPILALVGAGLGAAGYLFAHRLRRVARVNIGLCFPELDARAQRRYVRRHFIWLGVSLASVGVGWWGSERRLHRLVRITDRHYYDAAAAAQKNVILLAPHFLALDVGGIRLSIERPVVSMYRAAKNPVTDCLLRRRARFGATLIERSAHLKSLIRLLRSGMPFYYLPDQDPGGGDTVFAPFFGVPTATVTALSRMARLADAEVIPCVTRIRPWGRGYDLRFYPPLAPYPSDDAIADATRMNAMIEVAIRESPTQYLWVYKRFKTRPSEAERSFYG